MLRFAMISVLLASVSAQSATAQASLVLPEEICASIQKFDDALVFVRGTIINSTEYFAGARLGRFNATSEGLALYSAIVKACYPAH